jgi:hypothetical protein
MKTRFLLPLLAAGFLTSNPIPRAMAADPDAAEERARVVVRTMIDAMGGAQAFENTGALRFTFTYTSKDTLRTERTHWWNRRTGDYRIEGKTRKGEPYLLLFNTGTKDGRAFLSGQELEGEPKKQQLERAYALFINDTYWFLMPAKLFDPGVHLTMDGEAVVGGAPVDRVKVTFDNVGLTPGDTYWAYIDRASHLMIRWGMILQDEREKPDVKETQYDWTGWTSFGPLVLSPERVRVDDPDRTVIAIRNIQVLDSFPQDVFTNPKPIGL